MNRLAVLQGHLLPQPQLSTDQGLCRAALSAATNPHGAAVLVGGMVLDLQAAPTTDADVQRGGSVPGRVVQSPGGVARNVAESLAALCQSAGVKAPVLLSAVGDDLAGQALLAHWKSLGLSTKGVLRCPGGATPTVAVVFDRSGEVAACVADVRLLEQALTATTLRQYRPEFSSAPVVMLDGNLSAAAVEEACSLAAAAGVPVWFEPVSPPKSVRATAVLHLLSYASPNEAELVAMAEAVRRQQGEARASSSYGSNSRNGSSSSSSGSEGKAQGRWALAPASSSCELGCSPSQPSSTCSAPLSPEVAAALQPLLPHAATLLRAGLRHLVLTLGPLGAVLITAAPCSSSSGSSGSASASSRTASSSSPSLHLHVQHLPALPAHVVNCSGAGDCLVAGCLFGLVRGRAPLHCLALGVAASKRAVESQQNVPAGLKPAELERDAAVLLGRVAAGVARPAV